ncbi:kinase-like protein [Choiromyces venosus 120613-1]|uniref:non-specific serine/threonine protein kinase n=1 Tax=Choiromyces venosus 120613-1 TaxID=1336337 RepID=A0A3N4JRC9_9PEZI|nr:kinase-like protein [Choiromyces venosus 120613-1]
MLSSTYTTLTNHLESDFVESYRLNTEYDGNCSSYNEYLPGNATENWTVGEVVGRGNYTVVRRHVQEGTGRVRAVKTIEKIEYPFHAREFNIMAILSKSEHRSLFVELLGWFENKDRLFIAMEYFEQGDLRKHLDKPLAEEVVQKITKQVLNGLQVMHGNNIAYRCIKPEVKLGDFGISKHVHGDTALWSQVYTECYAAPEVLDLDPNGENLVYTNAVDIWALRCVVYELLTAEKLFGSLIQIMGHCYTGTFPEQKLSKLTTPTSDAVKSFIRRLVVLNSTGRPSAAEAAGDIWLEYVRDCPELSCFNVPLTEIRGPWDDQRYSPKPPN